MSPSERNQKANVVLAPVQEKALRRIRGITRPDAEFMLDRSFQIELENHRKILWTADRPSSTNGSSAFRASMV
jgi:hypothetical protein